MNLDRYINVPKEKGLGFIHRTRGDRDVAENTWLLIYGEIYETYAVSWYIIIPYVIQIIKTATKLDFKPPLGYGFS